MEKETQGKVENQTADIRSIKKQVLAILTGKSICLMCKDYFYPELFGSFSRRMLCAKCRESRENGRF